MAVNGCEWLEWIEWLKMAWNWLDIAEIGQNEQGWLEMAGLFFVTHFVTHFLHTCNSFCYTFVDQFMKDCETNCVRFSERF